MFWAVALVAVAVVFALENSEELLGGFPAGERVRKAVSQFASQFQRFSFIPRPLEAHYVALLSVSDASEGALTGPCTTREFVAKLLPRVADARPALITTDIAFTAGTSSDTCPGNAPETSELLSAVTAVAATTPIVLGQPALSLEQLKDEEAERLRSLGFGENDLIFRPPLMTENVPNVEFGLIRFNSQLEKVPLTWRGRSGTDGRTEWRRSLALAVAEMYRSTFPGGERRLRDLERSSYHPYTALLKEQDFAVVPSIRIMCDEAHTAAHDWRACSAIEGDSRERVKLRGRIVVLGVSDYDLWQTPVGKLPGYALHANYIESLLDARTYRALGLLSRIVLSFGWFALVELPFWWQGVSTGRALLLSAFASIIVLLLMNYVALVSFGVYVGLFAPSLLLIGARVVDRIAELLLARRHHGA
ncbi:MAG: CHASE2 domain-containing protein [Bryobacteraceae bacterium]